MHKTLILLKTLLRSTDPNNIYRHTEDKKKKKKIIWNFVGLICLYAMIMGYSILVTIGFGSFGIIDSAPLMCAFVISLLAFVFTFFMTDGSLFNFREYDMLMSLPFEAKTVAACKFVSMYIKSMPWYVSISLAMMIGYGYYARPSFIVYILWAVLSLILPVIPMLIASFFGFLIAKISAGFRKTKLIQTILTFIFIIFCFSLRFIIEGIFKNNKAESVLSTASEITGRAAGIYLPAGWFAGAVTELNFLDILLLAGVSALLFAAVFRLVGNSYRSMNSALRSHITNNNYRMSAQKKHSVLNAIAFKEFKRMTGSTVYLTNAAIGEVLAALLGIAALVIGFNRIISIVTQGAPFDPSILQPAIPFIVYFFIGMIATTACSPSLEGKSYWIIKSLPIENRIIYQGKMLFNLYLTIPFMIFAVLCLCISAKVSAVNTILYLLLGISLCAFSTAWGCVCGIRHMRLDWENEVEVVKQGSAVAVYMLPNMFAVMGLLVLVVFLGTRMDHKLLAFILILITGVLTVLSYLRAMALAKKTF